MAKFLRRVLGALILEASAYEEIESQPSAGMQSVLVVLAVTAAGGVAGMGLGVIGLAGFITGAIMALGAWLVWVSLITTLGTTTFAEPQTASSARELLRTLGFAAAPGVFLAFAAVRPAAPFVVAVVSVWMLAAAVVAVRQALDFKSLTRAVAVCAVSWALSIGFVVLMAALLTRPVE